MYKTRKLRIYPYFEQRITFARTFGCVQFIYNDTSSDETKYYSEKSEEDYCNNTQENSND